MTAVTDDDDDDFVVPVDYLRDPGRTGPEIHAALDPENRERFEAKWAEAIAHAARTYDLGPAERLLVQWRGVAAMDLTPEAQADVQRAVRRVAAGKESFVYWRRPGEPWPEHATERDRVIDFPQLDDDAEET